MRLKSALLGPFIFTTVLAAGLAVAEFGIRIVAPVYDPSGMIVYRAGPDGVILAVPGFNGRMWKNTGDYDVPVRINRHGFRDAKDLAQSSPHDIFLVGDSFSFGHGVLEEERFSNRLETELKTRIYNIAIPGDVRQYERLVAYARSKGARISRLWIALCMENDVRRYASASGRGTNAVGVGGAAHAEEPGKGPDTGRSRLWPDLEYWKALLTRHSALYNLATSAVHRLPAWRETAVRLGLIRPTLDRPWQNAIDPAAIEQTAERVAQFGETAELTVILIPSRGLWTGPDQAAERTTHAALAAALRAKGMRVIDLKGAFEATMDPLSLHFRLDGHWNASGHFWAARTIAQAFTEGQRGEK